MNMSVRPIHAVVYSSDSFWVFFYEVVYFLKTLQFMIRFTVIDIRLLQIKLL